MFLRIMYLLFVLLVKGSTAEEQPYINDEQYEDDQLHTVHILNQAFWNDSKMTVSVSDGIDNVVTSWTIQSNSSDLTGFFLTYRNEKKEHFDSPLLEKTSRQFSLPSLDKELTYTICVHALMNSTEVQHACTVYNENSLKIVVGIMAGVVFLIPCVLALVWLFRKDKRMTSDFERLLDSNSYNGISSVLVDTQDKKSLGYINDGYTSNDQLESPQKHSNTVTANNDSSQKDSNTVTVSIDLPQKDPRTVTANIDSPQKDPNTVAANIDSIKKNPNTVAANIDSLQKDPNTVAANIDSIQKNTKTVAANIDSPKKDPKTVAANIDSPQIDSNTVTADIESQKDPITVTANIASPQNDLNTVMDNIASPQKDSIIHTITSERLYNTVIDTI